MAKKVRTMTKTQAQEKIRYLLRQSLALEKKYGSSDYQKGKQAAYDDCLDIVSDIIS